MNHFLKVSLLCFLGVCLQACSSVDVKKEWASRGYSDSDKSAIQVYYQQYYSTLANTTGIGVASAIDTNDAKTRVRSIYCSCIKKLGDKCAQKSDGLSSADKDLWAKGNGAEMALKQYAAFQGAGMPTPTTVAVDPAECH